MGLKVWNGSGYVDANLPKVNASDIPQAAYVWDGTKYVKVWPEVWLTENWTYTDQLGWGPQFTMMSGATGRVSGGMPHYRVLSTTTAVGAEGGRANFTAPQDDMAVDFTFKYPTAYSLATNNESAIFLRVDTNMTSSVDSVHCVFLSGTVSIYTRINSTNTVRATRSYTIPDGTPLRYSAYGRGFAFVRRDTGEALVSWNDSTNLSRMGSAYRSLKLVLQSNRPVAQVQYQAPTIDDLVWGPSKPWYGSAMYRSTTSITWAQSGPTLITGWTADTTAYAWSSITSDGLVPPNDGIYRCQVSISRSGGLSTASTYVQIVRSSDGAVMATSNVVNGASGVHIIDAELLLSRSTDRYMLYRANTGGSGGTVGTGTANFFRVSTPL